MAGHAENSIADPGGGGGGEASAGISPRFTLGVTDSGGVSESSAAAATMSSEDDRTVRLINHVAYDIVANLVVGIGILGNLLNLIVLTRPKLKGVMYVYLLGLAVSNLCVLLTAIPALMLVSSGNKESRTYAGAFFVAHLEIPLLNSFMAASVYIIICMTVNRYISIYKPTHFQRIHTFKNAYLAIAASFAGGALLHVPLAFSEEVVPCGGHPGPPAPDATNLPDLPSVGASMSAAMSPTLSADREGDGDASGGGGVGGGGGAGAAGGFGPGCLYKAQYNNYVNQHSLFQVYTYVSEALLRFGPIITLTILNVLIIVRFNRIARKREVLKGSSNHHMSRLRGRKPGCSCSDANGKSAGTATAGNESSVVDLSGTRLGVARRAAPGGTTGWSTMTATGTGSVDRRRPRGACDPHLNGCSTSCLTTAASESPAAVMSMTDCSQVAATAGRPTFGQYLVVPPGGVVPLGDQATWRQMAASNSSLGSDSLCRPDPRTCTTVVQADGPTEGPPPKCGPLNTFPVAEGAISSNGTVAGSEQGPGQEGGALPRNPPPPVHVASRNNSQRQRLCPKHGTSVSRGGSQRGSTRRRGLHSPEERMLVVVLIAIVVLFVVCTTPAAFLSITFPFSESINRTIGYAVFRALANNLELLGFALNFFIYCLCSADIRKAFVDVLFENSPVLRLRTLLANSKVCGYIVARREARGRRPSNAGPNPLPAGGAGGDECEMVPINKCGHNDDGRRCGLGGVGSAEPGSEIRTQADPADPRSRLVSQEEPPPLLAAADHGVQSRPNAHENRDGIPRNGDPRGGPMGSGHNAVGGSEIQVTLGVPTIITSDEVGHSCSKVSPVDSLRGSEVV